MRKVLQLWKWNRMSFHLIIEKYSLKCAFYCKCSTVSGLILGWRPVNEKRCYKVTLSLIGWAEHLESALNIQAPQGFHWALDLIEIRLVCCSMTYERGIHGWLVNSLHKGPVMQKLHGFCDVIICSWWRHQMETFSTLLAIYAGNSLVTVQFPPQIPVTWSFDVFFDLHLNKRLTKQSWGWWFETLSRPLWRHCNIVEPP